ncbi:MAG: trigger factor [Bryobacteraceae bacterium]|nr:trigger factor [Bryobacteraceae bacterium]
MTTEQTCKRTLEITVPAEEVEKATERAASELAARVRLPGFRPGKVPKSLVRTRFAQDIRQAVVEELVPRFLQKKVEEENLRVVGTPDVTRIELEPGQPMRFTVEFEVAPEIELKPYRGLTVPYRDPEVSDEEIRERLEAIRERKAQYVTLEPRPAADGDYVAVALESFDTSGKLLNRQEEVMVHIGAEETLAEFTENLRGLSPGEEKEFEVSYPEDYGDEKLAGKTLRFRARVKAVRRKELPELNDEFAAEVGDFQSLEELREEVRRSLLREKEALARREAKNRLVEQLVKRGYQTTKLASTGGFLKEGNTTLFIGVENDKVNEAIKVIEATCHSRKQLVSPVTPPSGPAEAYIPYPVEVRVGGATVFVLDVEQFRKV